MTDLSIDFLGHRLISPLILASGIWGTTISLLERAARDGCGAITTKSCGPSPRTGHVNPSCIDWESGLINAIGLANPGADAEVELIDGAKSRLQAHAVPLIASIFAGTPAEFGQVATTVARAKPDMVEVNVSCPNVESDFGEPFAANPDSAASVTAAVKSALHETGIPLIVKLAPNVPSIGRIAQAVVEAGADALCAINTMPGLVIDTISGQPILANRSGGLSGPALKPIALKCVYDARNACPDIPIIGTGGVTTGLDAVEMLTAGANAVGIGSAIYYRGQQAIAEIHTELDCWLHEHGYASITEIQGRAHREHTYATQPSSPPVPAAH